MMLELRDLKKYFWEQHAHGKKSCVRAVDQVTLDIPDGENLGLVGESGSGKTTLGRLLVKLIQPDAGTIVFDGKDASRLSGPALRAFRQSIQMVFQDPYSSLDPRFTIYRILAEALLLEPKMSRQEFQARMDKALGEVGLNADVLARFPHEFSGGERQRIAIARSLIMNPRLLILDEAVSSLDVLIQEQIIQLLKEIQSHRPTAYLFITHNLRVVRKLCQRIAVMYQGKIVELAPTEEIFTRPIHPYTKRLLAAALEYRVPEVETDIVLPEKSQLREEGRGHFVIH